MILGKQYIESANTFKNKSFLEDYITFFIPLIWYAGFTKLGVITVFFFPRNVLPTLFSGFY